MFKDIRERRKDFTIFSSYRGHLSVQVMKPKKYHETELSPC